MLVRQLWLCEAGQDVREDGRLGLLLLLHPALPGLPHGPGPAAGGRGGHPLPPRLPHPLLHDHGRGTQGEHRQLYDV